MGCRCWATRHVGVSQLALDAYSTCRLSRLRLSENFLNFFLVFFSRLSSLSLAFWAVWAFSRFFWRSTWTTLWEGPWWRSTPAQRPGPQCASARAIQSHQSHRSWGMFPLVQTMCAPVRFRFSRTTFQKIGLATGYTYRSEAGFLAACKAILHRQMSGESVHRQGRRSAGRRGPELHTGRMFSSAAEPAGHERLPVQRARQATHGDARRCTPYLSNCPGAVGNLRVLQRTGTDRTAINVPQFQSPNPKVDWFMKPGNEL